MYIFLISVVVLITFVALYFTSIRCLINTKLVGEKTREFLQFLIHYAVVFVVMVFVLYSVKLGDTGESWQLGIFSLLTATFMTFFFCFVPTFLLAYFLYPFKFIKRGNYSKWIFIAVAIVFLICLAILIVALSFSNM